MKKRLPSVAVLSALLVALFAGAALAVNVINCTGSSTCQGTPQADDITGTDRPDVRGKIISDCEEVRRMRASTTTAQYRAADAELR